MLGYYRYSSGSSPMRTWLVHELGHKEATMSNKTISVLEGNNFVVSDVRGDIEASPTDTLGLFAWDTRFLSRWVLTIDGQHMNALSTDDLDYYFVQYFLVPWHDTNRVDVY